MLTIEELKLILLAKDKLIKVLEDRVKELENYISQKEGKVEIV